MSSSESVCLLIIDAQKDFHEGGSLAIPGATEDSIKISNFIKKNSKKISSIILSKDCHNRTHIANAANWRNSNSNEPINPFTTITANELEEKKYYNINYEPKDYQKLINYCKELEKSERFTLTLWPYHCIKDSPGYEIVDVIQDAINQWEADNEKKAKYYDKGTCDHVEMYSVFKAEVLCPECVEATQFNEELKNEIDTYDKVLICGEAKSHCVRYSTEDLLSLGKKVIFLEDCSSVVTGFDKSYEEFKNEAQKLITFEKIDNIKL